MKRFTIAAIAALFLLACPAEMWIPIDAAPRPPKRASEVQYLEALPDRPFIVLGIITPPEGEYETDAELVKVMREEAGKHGADAIFIESQDEQSGWKFDHGILGSKASTTHTVKARAKAIAWK